MSQLNVEIERAALFAADIFSEELDALSDLEKIELADKIVKRYHENTPQTAGGACDRLT